MYEQRQEEKERQAQIERDRRLREEEEWRQAEEERRRRAQPCYGITLEDWWAQKGGALFTRDEDLYVRASNTSEKPKYITISFKMNGHPKTERIKIDDNDTVEREIHSQGYDVSCSSCGYSEVRISSCQ